MYCIASSMDEICKAITTFQDQKRRYWVHLLQKRESALEGKVNMVCWRGLQYKRFLFAQIAILFSVQRVKYASKPYLTVTCNYAFANFGNLDLAVNITHFPIACFFLSY